jgi:H+/Na+-translocating ferredoxin:NAD+ oxidoreductase subunit B
VDHDAPAALVERIDAQLPQTQCRRCGYDGCLPYARAIAEGVAAINRCPPGGERTVASLAALVGVPRLPLDRSRGEPGPVVVARIDEAACIGCTLCIAACPVDAIVGAAKLMHTVLADRCTGCELCLPPCPVNCIALLPTGREWTRADAELARQRCADRAARRETRAARGAPWAPPNLSSGVDPGRARRQAAIAAALTRARARRASRSPSRSRP